MENRLKHTRGSDCEIRDEEEATAVAAAAYAIKSVEEAEEWVRVQELREVPISSTKTLRRKEDSLSRPYARKNAFPVRRPSDVASPQTQRQRGSPIAIQHNNNLKTRADVWEKAKMDKILKRYEKIESKILAWEREQKMQAKLHKERKNQSSMEHRRETELRHYQNKIARIDMIAQAARAQLEEKRRKEVSEVRETANKIRKTGRFPIKCFCFTF